MPDTPTDQPNPRRRGDGFPGRTDWNQAEDRFRAIIARLARDPDPQARAEAARILHRGLQVLGALTADAVAVQQRADKERALSERRRLAMVRQVNRLGRAGRPVGPSLAAYADPPQEPS
ncbi:hypothetical protein ACIRPX_05160 [Streptomyces sp. NPDC101225]|uniref:hypothetical protein n=1 Tax=Streptomyces sp. NPDC101225 TaxID=3366135 RepID=UPI0038308A70